MIWWRPAHAGRCAHPTVAGESKNGSTRCGGDRQSPPSRCIACQCAPPTAAGESGIMAPRNVVAAGNPSSTLRPDVDDRRCAPPNVSGESGNGFVRCGGGRLKGRKWLEGSE
jgi:hypothetical protein